MYRRKKAITIDLHNLYNYRPSFIYNEFGKSVYEIMTKHLCPIGNYNSDWLDGLIMGFILNNDWNKYSSNDEFTDYPLCVVLADYLYGTDELGFNAWSSEITFEEMDFVGEYISLLCDLKEQSLNGVIPNRTLTRRTHIKFYGDLSNMSEVVVYEH